MSKSVRVYGTSDLHIDYPTNWQWVESIDKDKYRNDVLLVGGDTTHDMDQLRRFFLLVRGRFRHVFFVPGNHDLWVTPRCPARDSVEKFYQIMNLCKECGIETKPKKVGSTSPFWVVPLFSWYHPSFANDHTLVNDPYLDCWGDFHCCKWPDYALNREKKDPSMPCGTPEEFFLKLNVENVHEYDAPVITFSHFLPRRELLPFHTSVPFLPLVVGTKKLEAQLRIIQPRIHLFGHTHINWDLELDGIRFSLLNGSSFLVYARSHQLQRDIRVV
eukprot:TRINITY_DN6102_c0_g4_i7.p1 TRINITY_DN6102_c0_g4~~TRINITY_DN6102_c0_g4_i7.p1  ORF type:complete len:273 (-),score=12.28 TRINITY_DN6102_c0_g4_i7:353-1171(-)